MKQPDWRDIVEKNLSEVAVSSNWHGLFSNSMAITSFLAFACVILFLSTIIRPDLMSMAKGDAQDIKGSKDPSLLSEKLLIEIADMEPNRLLAQGRHDEAVNQAISLLKAKPYDVRRVICAGNILTELNDRERGLQLLKKTPYLAPQSRYVRLNYARHLRQSKRYPEAIEQYQILIRVFPSLWQTPRLELGRLFVETGQFSQAIDQFETLLRNDTGNGTIRKELGIAMAAQGAVKEGYKEFLKGFNDELSFFCYPPAAKQYLDENNGSAEQAILGLKTAIETRPEHKGPRILLSQLFMGLGRFTEAKDVLIEARAEHYSDPELHQMLAHVFHRLNDDDSAFSEFRLAVNFQKKKQ